MSRRKDNYETSRWLKFKRWMDGETDPLSVGMDPIEVIPEEKMRAEGLCQKKGL